MQFIRPLFLCYILLFCRVNAGAQAVPDTNLNNSVIPQAVIDSQQARLKQRTRVVTIPETTDTDAVHKPGYFQPNPKKSALFSAIVPGTGQIYNRQYWKAGIVYVGIGVSAYFLATNTHEYQRYRKAYVARLSNPNYKDEFTGLYAESQMQSVLQQNQDYYKKYLDMTYLYSAVGYILQVIDALAFAHLRNFDISPDISMRMQPVAMPNGNAGFGLVMRWDKHPAITPVFYH